eukprot:TRINITY_DN3927_c0_g1_i1.p1 TRINITY_DN3927_c0_g1~~TRINITY_DN3927_c0_g1_i1.p1  ORF type:complete len:304 (+),score=54.33 TRINITY_DN3927_c0_g1_i1:38-949(+)
MNLDNKILPFYISFFASAGATMCGEIATFPIDVAKIRLQIQGELLEKETFIYGNKKRGMVRILYHIATKEGFKSLYAGCSPALCRQFVYGGLRLGLFKPIKSTFGLSDDCGIFKRIFVGCICGGIASSIATPLDLIKVRMQGHFHHYNNIFDAFKTIVNKEGVAALYKGIGPTVSRAMVLGGVELGIYFQTKHYLIKKNDWNNDVASHITSSLIAGLCSTICTNPIDTIKTRVMNQPFNKHGVGLRYKNTMDCVVKTFKKEFIGGFYKGFLPNYARNGIHCVITYSIYEQLLKMTKRIYFESS